MTFQPLLTRGSSGPWFSCGFYCNYTTNECLFALLIFPNSTMTKNSKVVWSANRNNPVSFNATLDLAENGNLALKHANGSLVWTTNTRGKSVVGLNLTEMGNLVLFDRENAVVWQSFDHPTDSLLPGQVLVAGQKLISNKSSTDWGEGLYALFLSNTKLVASMESDPPQHYYESNNEFAIPTDKTGRAYIRFEHGSFGGYNLSLAVKAQFMSLEADGHVRLYEWRRSDWEKASDLLSLFVGDCVYPMVCGNYGICSDEGQCSCPDQEDKTRTRYFKQKFERQPDLGCSLIRPISCEFHQFHSLVELKDISYSSFSMSTSVGETSLDYCKNTCLKTCSCKAVVFQKSLWNSSTGNCYLLPEVLSFTDSRTANMTIAYVKFQNPPKMETKSAAIALGTSLGALFGVYLIIRNILFIIWEKNESKKVEKDRYFHQLPGTPTRFSYEYLRAVTENFSRKLGEGGFGTVFEGTLHNGTKIAVKRLDKLEPVEKTFLAEVETIGNIHHVNLVRLIGFCIENSYRLLVYEYMSNGSLNKWIFSEHQVVCLRWQLRRKIILDIAKGLAYLHEGCRQKIFHLDIKPQNILLDENFNAKLSDFGLSKLIDKDQSKVVTAIKGTPGYMAPEWLGSFITEKVDVYSFGVMVLEILCGRRNLDRSQPEEDDMHLLSLFKRRADEKRLLDMVDKQSEDMQLHGAEVVELMKVAVWCLQSDFKKRPSMSVVIQALEGVVNIEHNLDYNLTDQQVPRRTIAAMEDNQDVAGEVTLLMPSVLSGPRS
ncbi:G-type lectin S-receptor-like serine/threonine-protein kinase [Actinidia chinensis var. chinensis]|uniref:Receptor-like serine/threonine-protein kinase n=1 Tax=Actinidia chinensis var. chinensis TaxID=1590841 RepID=A0A2R6P2X1_ACTCC|nr:G-type lectin S-receptor-like serine/threonine-protein kinase [Actinidia chinensis var. chinensis]